MKEENIPEKVPAQADEKSKRMLYDKQKEMLKCFLSNGSISRLQYDKSLGGLKKLMNIDDPDE